MTSQFCPPAGRQPSPFVLRPLPLPRGGARPREAALRGRRKKGEESGRGGGTIEVGRLGHAERTSGFRGVQEEGSSAAARRSLAAGSRVSPSSSSVLPAAAAAAAMALETVPKDLRHLRACLLCSLIKTIDQFEFDGCDNCDSYLQMKGNREMVYDCTSSSFDGIIAMMSPEDSWVSKWQRISNFKPGVYAVSVTGRLPQGIVRELKSRGVAYKSRDTAIKT